MTTITVQCPDEVLISLKEDAETFSRDLPLAAAMKLYELGRLSSGRSAQLAGMSRVAFLSRAGEYRVPIYDATPEELQEDMRHALAGRRENRPAIHGRQTRDHKRQVP